MVLDACHFMKILMPVSNNEATILRDCAKKKMNDLKTTTHDESLMFVYKGFGTSVRLRSLQQK